MFDVEQMKKTMVEFEVSVQSKSMHFKFIMKIWTTSNILCSWCLDWLKEDAPGKTIETANPTGVQGFEWFAKGIFHNVWFLISKYSWNYVLECIW